MDEYTRDGSFVQIPRWILLDSYVAADIKSLALYLYMHARARHTAGWINAKSGRGGSNSKPLFLERAQVAMGRDESKKIGISPNEYRSRMSKLATLGFIKEAASNKGTIVTIIHYDVFPPTYFEKNHQPKEAILTNKNIAESGTGGFETTNLFHTETTNKPPTDHQQTTNRPPTDHQQTTTNNKGKKEKKVKKNTAASLSSIERPIDVEVQVWSDWLAIRKSKRAGAVTTTGLSAIRSEAVLAGKTLNEALTICCLRNWIGFESSWLKDNRQDSRPVSNDSNVLRRFKPRERT